MLGRHIRPWLWSSGTSLRKSMAPYPHSSFSPSQAMTPAAFRYAANLKRLFGAVFLIGAYWVDPGEKPIPPADPRPSLPFLRITRLFWVLGFGGPLLRFGRPLGPSLLNSPTFPPLLSNPSLL